MHLRSRWRRIEWGWCVTAAMAASLVLPALPAMARGGSRAVDAELVFAVDISRSMNRDEQELQRAGYVAALTSPEFLNALKSGPEGKVAVAYVQWSSYSDQELLLDWSVIDGPGTARVVADKLSEAPFRSASFTSVSGAIDGSAKLFDNNGFDSARQIIDVSGDGPNNSGRSVVQARDEAVAHGIVINGLPLVGIRPYFGRGDIPNLDVYYQDCVIGGDGAFMVVIHDKKDFVDATRTKLVREIAWVPPRTLALIQHAQAPEPRVSCAIGEERSPWRWN